MSVPEFRWGSLSLDVHFGDHERVLGLEVLPSGTTRVGPVRCRALERSGEKNHLCYDFPVTSRDEKLTFQRVELLYRIGTGTELLRKRVSPPEVVVTRWVAPLVGSLVGLALFTLSALWVRHRRALRGVALDSPPGPLVSEDEKTFLARQLTEENYTGFFIKLREIERRSGQEFPLSPEKRERIQYAGEREPARDLPRLLGRFLKQLESPGEES